MKKNLSTLILLFTVMALLSCAKREYANVIVIQHCTGPYLRIDSLDYMVCNPEMIRAYKNGDQINADYSFSKECWYDGLRCMMIYDRHAGFVTINKIRRNR